jgi:hypothetical protein
LRAATAERAIQRKLHEFIFGNSGKELLLVVPTGNQHASNMGTWELLLLLVVGLLLDDATENE